MTASREYYMKRCLELAGQWTGFTTPNPLVGAVLVHNGRIIGEGAHQKYGGPHAEVNCLDSVKEKDRSLIPDSTLYVSLEPCAHFGKTPPCSQLIIKHKIPHVIIGVRDPFPSVDGKGIEQLLAAGIKVETGLLEEECKELNAAFFCYHQKHRPYIILKWAQTANAIIGSAPGQDRLLISSEPTNRLVHRWRRDNAAIMVGTNTALLDDPHLDNRYWPGPSPLKVVIDKNGRIPETAKLFKKGSVLVLTERSLSGSDSITYITIDPSQELLDQTMQELYDRKIQSVLVEGGAKLLHSFIEKGLWDEARIITNKNINTNGIPAPDLRSGLLERMEWSGTDKIEYYKNSKPTLG